MKAKILLTLLCAMSLQTQAFFGSQMLSTAWKATASFCKEHPIAVAATVAVFGISCWLYKKYTRTSSAARPATSATALAAGEVASAGATHAMAGGAIASVMQDEFPDFNTFEYSGEIKFKDIDFTRLTEPIIVDLRKYLKIGNCYEPVIIEKICTITSVDLYGFKIMAGEKTVGVLIYEKNSRNTSKLTMWCLVLYQNLRSLINIQKIIQKIEQDNIDNVTLYTDLISVEDDFQGQQKVFYLEFGFQELSDKENKFQMKLNQVVTTDEDTLRSSMRVPSVSMRTASASGAGAASATAENSIKFDSEEGRALIQEFLYESLQAKST